MGVALLAALVVLATLSPAGATVRRWLERTFDARLAHVHTRVGLDALPGGGRLLVLAHGAAWTVEPDGARRRLGPARDARWSPFGRFVALAGDRGLSAVDPRGGVPRTGAANVLVVIDRRVRTVLSGVGPFNGLAWSPEGKWLLVDWPAADQWVALRTWGRPRISAFSRIGSQFGGEPGEDRRAADWCCTRVQP